MTDAQVRLDRRGDVIELVVSGGAGAHHQLGSPDRLASGANARLAKRQPSGVRRSWST